MTICSTKLLSQVLIFWIFKNKKWISRKNGYKIRNYKIRTRATKLGRDYTHLNFQNDFSILALYISL